MKRLLFGLLLVSVAFLPGCSKEAAPTTGNLIVKAKLKNSTGYLIGVNIGLSVTKSDLDNSIYLKQAFTDGDGKVDFGSLNPGNYYYDCSHTISGVDYYGEGSIQIVAGENLTLTLVLE